ncbi:hypothetical protein L195_g000256 [Trifolium pratense]|uniref:Uncharacterized protein n=1 Tax=Trifolium pratense TaxID=57577 RepID=A0A2K3NLD3_TRIPR|nr:hypothetical protein L195_g000256 [Trifolium pratense]
MILFRPAPGVAVVPFFGAPFFFGWFDTGFGFTRLRVLCLGSVQADGGVGDNLAADPTVVLEWCSKWGFRGCGRGDRSRRRLFGGGLRAETHLHMFSFYRCPHQLLTQGAVFGF